jgi:hypothetical protein
MLGFWGIQIVAWVKNHIVSAIFYYVRGKRQMIDIIENDLRRNKMPIYDDQEYLETEDYIARVVSDKCSQKDQLVFAGSIGGILNTILGVARVRLISNFDAALKRYSANSGNLEELKRMSDDMEGDTNEDRARNGYETSTQEELPDEEADRQAGIVLGPLKAKAWWASSIMWGYHTKEMSKETAEYEWGQYLKFKDTVYRHLGEVTDEFYRNTAIHFIIEMLIVAGEVDEAQSLLEQMTVDFIRDKAEAAIKAGPKAVYMKQREAQQSAKLN